MTSELKPLIDDTSRPSYIRNLLRQARSAKEPRYDFDAGLAKHKALIASGASLPEWASDSLTGVINGTTLLARILGIASVPVIGGIIAYNALVPSGGEYRSHDAKSIAVVELPAQSLTAPAADVVKPTTAQAKGRTTKDIEGRSTPSTQEATDETIAGKKSPTSKPRRRLHRPRPSDTIAQPQTATTAAADKHFDDESTTGGFNVTEVAPGKATEKLVSSFSIENEPKTMETPPVDDTLQREMKLLAEARRLVNVSPLRSLALARAREPRTGILSEEWDQVDLLALIRLGRLSDAQKGVRRFRNRYPNSAFNERLRKELLPPRQ